MRYLNMLAACLLVLGLDRCGLGQESSEKYMGVAKCKKCHKDKKLGDQYSRWKELKHSKAYKGLDSDKSREVAQKAGVTGDPQKSDKCLKCHVTAHGVPAERIGPLFKIEDGVQCEACHGPGRAYAKRSVMKKVEKAKAKGLVPKPAAESCKKCHSDESPSWDPNKYTLKDGTKVGFDYEQAMKKVEHPRPKKEK